jgi:membrane protein DedA with SNARE-associated domain
MQTAIDVLIRHGYAVVFGWVLAEQIGLPLPAVPFLLASGALAGGGHLSLPLVLLAASVASLLGDLFWYWIGRVGGMRVLGWLCKISLEPNSCVIRTQRTFATRGARSLLFAKFVPGYNTVAPPLAGIIGMPLTTFVLFTGLGGVIWAGAFIGLGWVFSAQLELVAAHVARFGSWTLVAGGAALGSWITYKAVGRQLFLRKMKVARITPAQLKAQLDHGEDVMVVDLRDRAGFEAEPWIIPGALALSTEDLEDRHQEIPRGREIVLYCTCPSEATSARAALILRGRGIERVRPLAGGFRAWQKLGYPLTAFAPVPSGGK